MDTHTLNPNPNPNLNPNPNPNPDPNPNADLHPKVIDDDLLRNSGREMGLVKPPVVSIAPSSGNPMDKVEKQKPKILTDLSLLIGDDGNEDYPYDELKFEHGFFIPTQPNATTDKLLADIHKSIDQAKKRYGEVELNEDGDEILEVLTIKTKKRNDDGTIQLQNGEPITGANATHRLKYIYTRNYIAKAVVKGQKLGEGVEAEGDGVVVIRVA